MIGLIWFLIFYVFSKRLICRRLPLIFPALKTDVQRWVYKVDANSCDPDLDHCYWSVFIWKTVWWPAVYFFQFHFYPPIPKCQPNKLEFDYSPVFKVHNSTTSEAVSDLTIVWVFSVWRVQGVTPMTRSTIYYWNILRQNWELNKKLKLKYNSY